MRVDVAAEVAWIMTNRPSPQKQCVWALERDGVSISLVGQRRLRDGLGVGGIFWERCVAVSSTDIPLEPLLDHAADVRQFLCDP
jgi:hypothetical protein